MQICQLNEIILLLRANQLWVQSEQTCIEA